MICLWMCGRRFTLAQTIMGLALAAMIIGACAPALAFPNKTAQTGKASPPGWVRGGSLNYVGQRSNPLDGAYTAGCGQVGGAYFAWDNTCDWTGWEDISWCTDGTKNAPSGPTVLGIEYHAGPHDYGTCACVRRQFQIGFAAAEVAHINVQWFEPNTVSAGAVGVVTSSRPFGATPTGPNSQAVCSGYSGTFSAACRSENSSFAVGLPGVGLAGGVFTWNVGNFTFQKTGECDQSWNVGGQWTGATITDSQTPFPHGPADLARWATKVSSCNGVTALEGAQSFAGADGYIDYMIFSNNSGGAQYPQNYQDSIQNGVKPDFDSAYAFQNLTQSNQ